VSWLEVPAVAVRKRPALPQGAARPLAVPAAAAALLGLARLAPASGAGLWLRLAAATAVLLLPGVAVARCLGQRTAAAGLAWSAALAGGGLALTFALGDSLAVTLAFVLACGAAAFAWLAARPRPARESLPARARLVRAALALAGLALGGALWFVEGVLKGDSLFHLGRIRKLDVLGSLSLHDVGEFRHGGLHPGYAFPLWHGWLAAVARLAGVDPTWVALHESSLLAPLALVLAFEMGWAIFRSSGVALAVVAAQVAIKAFAAGHGGVYAFLWQPGTTASQLLAPAALALLFSFLRRPGVGLALSLAVDSAVLSLVHPTYALFVAIPVAGFALTRAVLTRGAELRRLAAGLGAFGAPMGLAYAWLAPVVAQTVAVNPGSRQLAKSLAHYHSDLVVRSLARYSLAPERVDRSGSVVVAALVLVPLAFFARRRRWASLVLGGTVAVLAIELWPLVFPRFSDLVSLSQARRAAGFVPFAVAFAGGAAVLCRRSRLLALLLALGCGIWLQLSYGGDFGLRAPRTEPALATWIALYGGAAAIVLAALAAWRAPRPPGRAVPSRGLATALAAGCFVLPVVVHGCLRWSPKNTRDVGALSPGLVTFLRQEAPPRSVVFGDLATGYEAVAYAPVYAVAVPPTHAANTRQNQVFKRRRAWLRFLRQPSLFLPRRWHADWLVLRRSEPVQAIERLGVRPVYADRRFVVFRVPPGRVPLRP